ncbi:polyprenyl p-hydroxybenzoate/phenylacrylic acid decarboxylase [Alistipes sp. CAG:157]|nr:polyprenyl p-hydroxybenzoate/phenylacrylic acid decarboxylase [Alistipes sp. CAG:157]
MKRIIVAVTGASGAVYARKVAERLLRSPQVAQVAVVCSANGRKVMEYERERLPEGEERMVWFDNDDLFAPPASGSAGYDGMVIVPCTMGSAGRLAAGISGDLIGRAADVMLKERRPLVLVVRETPLSTIHLRNLTLLSECGAVVLPASPSFYSRPADIEALCDTVAVRAVRMLGVASEGYEWGAEEE